MPDRARHSGLPPGWPADLPPPAAPGFARRATGWLLDLCPPEYRGHPVLARHPVALCWLAARHVQAARQAADRALATARSELSADLAPEPLAELLEVLEQEQARLLRAVREVALVQQALRGRKYVPRL